MRYHRIPNIIAAFMVLAALLSGCGAQKTEVPDVVGMEKDAAEESLQDGGLVIGDIAYEFSQTVSQNLIVSQSPAGGLRVEKGTPISLTVSRGSKAVEEPSTVERPPRLPFLLLLLLSGVLAYVSLRCFRENAFRGTYMPRFRGDIALWLVTTIVLALLLRSCL